MLTSRAQTESTEVPRIRTDELRKAFNTSILAIRAGDDIRRARGARLSCLVRHDRPLGPVPEPCGP